METKLITNIQNKNLLVDLKKINKGMNEKNVKITGLVGKSLFLNSIFNYSTNFFVFELDHNYTPKFVQHKLKSNSLSNQFELNRSAYFL